MFGKQKHIQEVRELLFNTPRVPQKPIKLEVECPNCHKDVDVEHFLNFDLKLMYQTQASKKLYVLSEEDIKDALDGKLRRIEELHQKRMGGDKVGRRNDRTAERTTSET